MSSNVMVQVIKVHPGSETVPEWAQPFSGEDLWGALMHARSLIHGIRIGSEEMGGSCSGDLQYDTYLVVRSDAACRKAMASGKRWDDAPIIAEYIIRQEVDGVQKHYVHACGKAEYDRNHPTLKEGDSIMREYIKGSMFVILVTAALLIAAHLLGFL